MSSTNTNYILQYIATLDDSEFKSVLESMKKKNGEVADKIKKDNDKTGKSFESIKGTVESLIGSKLALGAAMLAISARTIAAVKDMAKFQTQLSKINTLLKIGRDDLNRYGDALINLSIRTGMGKDQIAEGLYQALSAGVNADESIKFMEVATKTAMAGFTDVTTAVDGLTTVINAYKLSTSDATKVSDVFLKGQELGKITVDEIGKSIGDLAPIAASAGISVENLVASLSTMTANGVPASQAATQLKQAMAQLTNSGSEASKTFKEFSGKTFQEFIRDGGSLAGALGVIKEASDQTGKSITQLMGSVEAGNATLSLTGINAQKASDDLLKVSQAAGTLEESYKLATDNMQGEWDKLMLHSQGAWLKLVKNMEKPITVTLKTIRMALGSGTVDEYKDNYTDAKANYDSAQTKRNESSVDSGYSDGKDIAFAQSRERLYRALQNSLGEIESTGMKGREDEYVKHIDELMNLRKDMHPNFKADALQKELFEKRVQADRFKRERIAEEAETKAKKEAEEAENKRLSDAVTSKEQAEKDRIQSILDAEKKHSTQISNIDLNTLRDKKDYLQGMKEAYETGTIDLETYTDATSKYAKELADRQSGQYLESLRELQNFYKSVGEILKANELEKKILEIEVRLTGIEKLEELDTKFQDFNTRQEAQDKSHKNNMLLQEWTFVSDLVGLKEDGKITAEEFDQRVSDYKDNQFNLERDFEIAQLEAKRDFLLNDMNQQEAAFEIQKEIDSKKNAQYRASKAAEETKIKWESWAANSKVDIQETSADAVMATYQALASGQIKSLDDFKKFAQQQISNLLMQKGSEHMAIAISDLAKGISFAANPLTASLAPPEFASAAHNAGLAAAFGAGSALISPSSSSSDNGYDNSVKDNFSEDVQEASKDKEGDVFIDVSDSELAKLMVKTIEKELNDGYNVTMIGKKK